MEPVRDLSAEDGDRSLVRWMLSLTPSERLDVLQEHVDAVLELRERNGVGSVRDRGDGLPEPAEGARRG